MLWFLDKNHWKPLKYTQECNISFLILQVRYCEEIGISADAASRLYIYAGISSTVGRVLVGRLCDLPWVNALYVSQAVEFVGGTATILMTLSQKYAVIATYFIVFNFCDGAFISSLNIVLVTLVPEDQRASAIAWQFLLASPFLAGGPPLAGKSLR